MRAIAVAQQSIGAIIVGERRGMALKSTVWGQEEKRRRGEKGHHSAT